VVRWDKDSSRAGNGPRGASRDASTAGDRISHGRSHVANVRVCDPSYRRINRNAGRGSGNGTEMPVSPNDPKRKRHVGEGAAGANGTPPTAHFRLRIYDRSRP